MGTYYCPDCGRPEGEWHKAFCKYGNDLVSWYDREEELQLEYEKQKRSLMVSDEDELDGMCDPSLNPPPTSDDDIAGVVLFADVDPNDVDAIERRTDEWRQVFNA